MPGNAMYQHLCCQHHLSGLFTFLICIFIDANNGLINELCMMPLYGLSVWLLGIFLVGNNP
jgi:hypothetical protein